MPEKRSVTSGPDAFLRKPGMSSGGHWIVTTYADGLEVRLGDRVRLGGDSGGAVVCDIGSGQFSADFPANEWAHLQKGIVVAFPAYGIIHMEEPEPDLHLVGRSK